MATQNTSTVPQNRIAETNGKAPETHKEPRVFDRKSFISKMRDKEHTMPVAVKSQNIRVVLKGKAETMDNDGLVALAKANADIKTTVTEKNVITTGGVTADLTTKGVSDGGDVAEMLELCGTAVKK